MKEYKSFTLILFLLIIMSSICYGQVQDENPTPTPVPTPKPYDKDEFPQWLKDLRRGEVIMIGSIPFTFFLSIEIFDLYRYISKDFDRSYAPWPFNGQNTMVYENNEKYVVIITAVSLSVSIAITDYIITRIIRGKKRVPRSKNESL